MNLSGVVWFFMSIGVSLAIYCSLLGHMNTGSVIFLAFIGFIIIYAHRLFFVYLTWTHSLPKETLTKYLRTFGIPWDVGKERVIWKNVAGFDETWIQDEEIAHSYPTDHIDFVYSTLRVPDIQPEHVCIIAEATGSIFLDMLKEEAIARCHYLVKNAVSIGFVQDVVAGSITKEDARDEYARRIINNDFPDWFPDPLNEAERTLGEGGHHVRRQ